jgi:hypothetical protein
MPRTNAATKLRVHALTPDLWPAFEDLFGKWGASNGCWCMYWRLGGDYRGRLEENKRALRRIVKSGSPPGLLAFDGNLAVGWCQLTPRDALPRLDHMWWFRRVDALPVWSISCFFIRRTYRRQRAMTQLIFAALKAAKRARAAALEAYPIDTAVPNSTSNTFTGTASTFARAGFKEVARLAPARPIMRHDLKAIRALEFRSKVQPPVGCAFSLDRHSYSGHRGCRLEPVGHCSLAVRIGRATAPHPLQV